MQNWSDEAFAGYLAAMIDGEGHIEIPGTNAVRVRIANTAKPTLDAIAARLGFGRVTEYARPADRNYKRLFCLEVSSVADVARLFSICGRFIHMKPDQMARAMLVIDRVAAETERVDRRNASIRTAIAAGDVQTEIARKHGVSPQLISRIKKGHIWPSVVAGQTGRKNTRRFPRIDQSFRVEGAEQ